MQGDIKHWLALSAIKNVGPGTVRKLLAHFKTPENIFKATLTELKAVEGVKSFRAESVKNFNSWDAVELALKKIEQNGIKVFCYLEDDYPEMLKPFPDSPPLLFVKGDIVREDRYAIAIVGTRKLSHYGQKVAEKFTGELVDMGFTIVSGMARGIDTIAHREALKCNGRTIAVLGTGIDIAYPPENLWLMQRIAENGAVVSEFLPGTRPQRENFPIRNRIISALSLGVLVVEAGQRSGALITANFALEQGKEVFAVPGNVLSLSAQGSHSLIQSGAKLVNNACDILGELGDLIKAYIKERKENPPVKRNAEKSKTTAAEKRKVSAHDSLRTTSDEKPVSEQSDDGKKVFSVLGFESMHVDEIIRKTLLPAHKVLNVLLELELKGLVKQSEGMKFYIV
ncbi:MAG: DNA-protecting protein DprA [Nitrospirae bacterium]|nr:DNA-protecting protein DprA [Nitrospirota bacterium]